MLSYEFQKLNRLVRSLLPIRPLVRWRECAAWVSFPTAPRAVVRTFNAHKYPFIRDVRHIQQRSARFFLSALSPEIKGRSARIPLRGGQSSSRRSPFFPRKSAGFLFLSNSGRSANTAALLPLSPILLADVLHFWITYLPNRFAAARYLSDLSTRTVLIRLSVPDASREDARWIMFRTGERLIPREDWKNSRSRGKIEKKD